MTYQLVIDDEIRRQAELAIAQGRKLDLKNDVVFKSFFSKDCEESAFCRRKLLSAVIGRVVKDTKVLNPELPPQRIDGKFPRLDIHCVLEDGSQVDVEIQNNMYEDDQIKRTIYYASALAHNSLSAGKPYAQLPQVYQIMFMDFIVTNDIRLHHSYTFREDKDYKQLSDIMQIHYIELPKLKNLVGKVMDDAVGKESVKPVRMLSELEFWSMMIIEGRDKNARKKLAEFTGRNKEVLMADALLDKMSLDREEWERQLSYERFVHDCMSREAYAYMKGEEKGAQESTFEAVKSFYANGVSVDIIAKSLKMTVKQVKKIVSESLLQDA